MDAEWFLKLGWSVFRRSAGRCDESARAAFEEKYGPSAESGAEDFSEHPGKLGEALSFVAKTGSLARLMAARHGRDVTGEDVLEAASAVEGFSGTTYC